MDPNEKKNTLENTKNHKGSGFKKFLLYSLGILFALILLFVWVLKPRDTQVEVIGFQWERVLDIEHYIPVKHSDWSLPAGAKLLKSYKDIHHYNKVLDHYEERTRTVEVKTGSRRVKVGVKDKGNGYFEDVYKNEPIYTSKEEKYKEAIYREEPVYQTKYDFEIMEWVLDRKEKTEGKDHSPKDPEVTLLDDTWRKGKMIEKYTIHVKMGEGNPQKEDLDYAIWKQIEVGEILKAETNAIGSFYGIDKSGFKQ